jgi:hypothetical protein
MTDKHKQQKSPRGTASVPESGSPKDRATEIAEKILKHWDVGKRQPGGCSTLWLDEDRELDSHDVERLAKTIRPIVEANTHICGKRQL